MWPNPVPTGQPCLAQFPITFWRSGGNSRQFGDDPLHAVTAPLLLFFGTGGRKEPRGDGCRPRAGNASTSTDWLPSERKGTLLTYPKCSFVDLRMSSRLCLGWWWAVTKMSKSPHHCSFLGHTLNWANVRQHWRAQKRNFRLPTTHPLNSKAVVEVMGSRCLHTSCQSVTYLPWVIVCLATPCESSSGLGRRRHGDKIVLH